MKVQPKPGKNSVTPHWRTWWRRDVFISGDAPDIETSTVEYAGRFAGPVGTWMLDEQWRAVWSLLRECPGNRVLDLGGGHAQITGALLEQNYDVTILGSDPCCINRVSPFLGQDRCRFHVGPLTKLPYADNSFDVVIVLRVMAHIDHWQDMLEEAARVARHAVILDYPSKYSVNSLERVLFGLKKLAEGNTRHFRCFTTRAIDRACRPHNLSYDDRRRQFLMPMVLHRVMKMPKLSAFIEGGFRRVGLTHLLGSPVVLKMKRVHHNGKHIDSGRHPDVTA